MAYDEITIGNQGLFPVTTRCTVGQQVDMHLHAVPFLGTTGHRLGAVTGDVFVNHVSVGTYLIKCVFLTFNLEEYGEKSENISLLLALDFRGNSLCSPFFHTCLKTKYIYDSILGVALAVLHWPDAPPVLNGLIAGVGEFLVEPGFFPGEAEQLK